MKKLLVIILPFLFLAGCWTNSYVHNTYYPDGQLRESYKLVNMKAMVNSKTGKIDINLPDGASLRAVMIETKADPNSAKAIGEMLKNVGFFGLFL